MYLFDITKLELKSHTKCQFLIGNVSQDENMVIYKESASVNFS